MNLLLLPLLLFVLLNVSIASAMSSTLPKKQVLVTGANKGIGRAICKAILEQYPEVKVWLASRNVARGQAAVQELLEEIPDCNPDCLEMIEMDTTNEKSVQAAAAKLKHEELFGIVNNAGIGFGRGFQETIDTNYFGPRRVNDAFSSLLQKPGGRIVNVASASGPNFLSRCSDESLKNKLTTPNQFINSIAELDDLAKSYFEKEDYDNDAYGVSKAFLNAYTALHAKAEPDLVINSCSPGYILTDLTAGMGATNPPSKGAVCPVWLLLSDDPLQYPTGRYYGSDCVRSPLHFYRGPGEEPYDGPDA